MDPILLKRFEASADRRGTHCEKWDNLRAVFGRDDVLPLWVADMDFQAPAEVVEALTARALNGIYGYSIHDDASDEALIGWMRTRHGLSLQQCDLRYSPGIVQSMLYALRAICAPGDKVAVMTPVYGPFYRMVRNAGMELVRCPLAFDGGYRMDLGALEDAFKGGVKGLLLCSPHNPVGRVWTASELTELVALCNRYGVGIVSDEIHMDFEMPGHVHTPILNVPGGERAILLASATKTFNLAGLRHSSILVKDPDMRSRLDDVLRDCGAGEPNLFGNLGQTVAYQHGGPWLDALIEYLDGSRLFVEEFLTRSLPEVRCARLEGTYLMWLDFRALGLDADALKQFLVNAAGVGLNSGTDFGAEGAGFARMNLATPRRNIETALAHIERAVRAR